MSSRTLPALVLASLLKVSIVSPAAAINTAEIVEQTASAALACLRWMPVGMCFWLQCSLVGCSIETAIKVGHYNPDLVVSVYNELGGNPWDELRATLGLAQRAAATGLLGTLLPVPVDSAGNRTEGSRDRRDHHNLVFREADAIGHPVSSVSSVVGGVGLMCASQATSFVPYFQSGVDALAWRQEIPEIFYVASYVPGLREIGGWPLQTWGNVHPRTGWTIQAEEPKAAAVTAQRAGDIVTRSDQPHLYLPLSDTPSESQRVWPPGPLVETDAETGTWQMLVPLPEPTCGVFGENDLVGLSGWGGGRVDEAGDYLWNLWRPYQCCSRRGQVFLLDINWIEYPP